MTEKEKEEENRFPKKKLQRAGQGGETGENDKCAVPERKEKFAG